MTTPFDLELDVVDSVDGVVVAVVRVEDASCAPVSSLRGPLGLRLADIAAGGLTPARVTIRTTHRHRDPARWRVDGRRLRDTARA
jgi:hypothetical protein